MKTKASPQQQTKKGVRKKANGTSKREQRTSTDTHAKTQQYNT